jgi:hypothetical protein
MSKETKIKPGTFIHLKDAGLQKMRLTGKKGGFSLKAYASYSEMVATEIYKKAGCVTVDDIRAHYEHYKIPIINNKWFSFFGNYNLWQSIGTKRSSRQVARGRQVQVWIKKCN